MADVQDLPLEDNTFDAVISESIAAFPEDKEKAISEYVRVVKKGGYIRLNEVTWMEEPTKEMAEYGLRAIGKVRPETAVWWEQLLRGAGLGDFLISSDLLNNKEPQINADERRFRMQYPRLFAFIRG